MSPNSTALPPVAQPSCAPPPDFSSDRPGFIAYGPAEQALFEALRPEMRLLAQDVARLDLALDAAVAEVVDAAWPKALAHLRAAGTLQVFTDEKLEAKLNDWAVYWCKRAAEGKLRSSGDTGCRLTDEQCRNGGKRSGVTRRQQELDNAVRAVLMRAEGMNNKQIAETLDVTDRTIRNYFRKGEGEAELAKRRERRRIFADNLKQRQFAEAAQVVAEVEAAPVEVRRQQPEVVAVAETSSQPVLGAETNCLGGTNPRLLKDKKPSTGYPQDSSFPPPPDDDREAEIAAGKAAWERFFGRKLATSEEDVAEPDKSRYAVNALGQRVRVSP